MTQLITLYFALPAIFMTAVTGTRRYLRRCRLMLSKRSAI
jgi:hypothetical protein